MLDNVYDASREWTQDVSDWHINRLELRAVQLMLMAFKNCLRGQTVLIRSDNTTTCAYINKQGGPGHWNCVHKLTTCGCGVWTTRSRSGALYIPGRLNVHADRLSWGLTVPTEEQGSIDQREWSIPQEVADAVFRVLGDPHCDLFAAACNAKLPAFYALYSGAGEVSVDSLSADWHHLFGYAFPPTVLIPRVLNKLVRDKATIILIAPRWPERVWYSTLLHLSVHPPVQLLERPDLLSQLGQFHPQPSMFKLMAWKLSGVSLLATGFRKRLSLSWREPWHHFPLKSTTDNGVTLSAGVVDGISIPILHL